MDVAPRTGRPVGEDGKKNKLLQVRIDEKTLEKLDYCAERLNLNRSDVVRSGIQLVSKQLDK